MPKRKHFSSCEIPPENTNKKVKRNRLYSYKGDFRWKGIRSREYKTGGDDWDKIARQVLIGAGGEKTKFHVRYFEIERDGYSSFETHRHEHVVIVIRGKGRARLNKRDQEIGFLDILYICPNSPHRLYNPYDEPFGFLCIVDSKRDKPVPVKKTRTAVKRNN